MENKKEKMKESIEAKWEEWLSDEFRTEHKDELTYLLNEITTDAANEKQALKKLETIYISNAENLAILSLEKLKGEHKENQYTLEGWLNDVYHLNLYQQIIETILSSIYKKD